MSQTFVQLGSIAEFINGAAFKPEDWGESGMRIIRIQNLTDSNKPFNRTKRTVTDRVRVQQGDLLVSWSATLGIFEWNDSEEALLNQHIFRVLPNEEKVNKRYLRYGLEGAILDMQKHLHGATMQHVNRGEFLSTKLYLPPLEEQRRIAEILDRAEELRFKRREAIAQLDTLTQAIFFEMFSNSVNNFDTVRIEEVASKSQYALSSGPFGSNLTSQHYLDDGVPILRGLNVTGDRLTLEHLKFISEKKARELARSEIKPGDIVVVAVGSSGLAYQIPNSLPRAIMSQNFNKITPDLQKVNATYLTFCINTSIVQNQISQKITDTVRTFLSLTKLKTVKIPLPPLSLQQEFAHRVEAVEKLKAAHCASLSELNALFASLQHRAFRGEL